MIRLWWEQAEGHFIQCACHFTDTCTTCDPDGRTVSKRMEIKQLIVEIEVAIRFLRNQTHVCVRKIVPFEIQYIADPQPTGITGKDVNIPDMADSRVVR